MSLGIVIIGRNEGSRLKPCLESAMREGLPCVYVDSGSADGSVQLAKDLGCLVHELSPDQPFSAARARNEGLARLFSSVEGLESVQFLDGDSGLEPGWLSNALAVLESEDGLCAVFGSIRERHPELSVFNRYTAVEWQAPAGDALSFGGICLCRVSALRQVEGFDQTLVAGEEPELASRLRQAGWRIRSLPLPMAIHDAGMTSFSRWFSRCIRTGYVYSQASQARSGADRSYGRRPSLRIWAWIVILPIVVVLLAIFNPLLGLLMAALFPLQTFRMSRSFRKQGMDVWHSFLCGMLWHVSLFGQWRGQCRYWFDRLRKADALVLDKETQAMTSVFDKKAETTGDVRHGG